MKRINNLAWLLPFLIFTGLSFILNEDLPIKTEEPDENEYYTNALMNKARGDVSFIADYNFDIRFQELNDTLAVKEKIIWRNKTEFKTNELYLHLYANAYKSNRTIFASVYNVVGEAKTEINVKSLTVNGEQKELEYVQPDVDNPHDSTVAKINLSDFILPGDSVEIELDYALRIPVSIKRFGKARGADFYFVSQWYPKIGVFENGRWVCNQYFPRLNFYSDFGRYNAKINLPAKYNLASTGIVNRSYTSNNRTTYEVVQDGVHDFAFTFATGVIDTSDIYKRKDGSGIRIKLLVQADNDEYIERFFNSIKFVLKYFEKNVGEYPYQQITMVDCPRSSASGGMEYPTLFTVGANLFSPENTHYPEKLVFHEFIHQYFYGILANNETAEAWLDEGFTSYFASKVTEDYFGKKGYLTFKAFSYLPVYGINFLGYNEIPIIYSLGFFEYPEEGRALKRYYLDKITGAIADTSYKLPSVLSYVINAYSKPELMLHSLERIMGQNNFNELVKKYYFLYKFKHPKSNDFISLVKNYSNENLDWFFENVFYSSKIFDDRIRYLRRVGENEYEFFAERLGDGYFKNDIFCYTESDTIKLIWSEKKKYKIFRVKTEDEIIAVEIDPLRKNLFDVNYSNNSYTIEEKIWGTASISIKWYFWIQNALMVLGSIG